jgi:hypothetical protein
MGCGPSKSQGKAQRRQGASIGAPQNVAIHIPRNRADAHGVPLQQFTREVDRDTLLQALDHVSNYIAQRTQHVTAIAVGGAVNTLYLRSRRNTHDVDLFGSEDYFGNAARMLLDEASQDAQQHIPQLGTDWINTETQMWMPGPMHTELTAAAVQQQVVVFPGAGLTIYAAPWAYAFSAKINRILTGGAQRRSYDLADAVNYIHEYIRSHGNQPVQVSRALGWARRYHHESNEDILRNRVDPEHRRRYNGHRAFV